MTETEAANPESDISNTAAVAVSGRPWLPGQSGNPKGRPPKATSISAILRSVPMKDKRKLVETAYKYAIKGDDKWAEWIAKHSGEGAAAIAALQVSGDNVQIVFANVPSLDA